MNHDINWYYGGLIVRGNKVAIERFIQEVKGDFELVIISCHISSSFLRIQKEDFI